MGIKIEAAVTDDIDVFEKNVRIDVIKVNDAQQLIFGWACIVATADGTPVVDAHDDIIEEVELEYAVYDYVKHSGAAGVEHKYMYEGVLVESMVFTKEKTTAIGIPDGTLPTGWWVGFYIYSRDLYEACKNGDFGEFSIGGKAVRVPAEP